MFASKARTAENPWGREDAYDYIKQANMIACRVCLLWLLATIRHTYFFIEQPSSSRLVILPYIEFVVKTLSRYMSVFRTFLYLGLDMFKQFHLDTQNPDSILLCGLNYKHKSP